MDTRPNSNRRVWLVGLMALAAGYVLGTADRQISEVVWAQQRVFRGETAATLQAIEKQVEKIAAAVERIDMRLARLERRATSADGTRPPKGADRAEKGDRSP